MAIEVNSMVEYAALKSKRFLCASCMEFLIELTPIVKKGMRDVYFKQLREIRNRAILSGKAPPPPPRVRLQCPHGHHKFAHFAFHDVTMPKGRKYKPT